jgi:DNA-binding transcriptional regulator YhcF (GntR family)
VIHEHHNIDREWVELIQEALKVGISKDEIMKFFKEQKMINENNNLSNIQTT